MRTKDKEPLHFSFYIISPKKQAENNTYFLSSGK